MSSNNYSISQLIFLGLSQFNSIFQLQVVKLIIGMFGMSFSYLTFGIIQEKLFNTPYKTRYDDTAQVFAYTSAIILFPSFISIVIGIIGQKIFNQKQCIPVRSQIILGFQCFIIMYTTNAALIYVSFPLQNMIRNYKLLFIVIFGVFFSKVKDSKELKLGKFKLVVGIIITVGVMIFSHCDEDSKDIQANSYIGIILLIISIVVDGFFSDYQALIKKLYNPSINQLFLSINLYTFIFASIYSIFTFELFQMFVFIRQHSDVIKDLILLSILGCIGQMSIYYIIKNFKQHIVPLLATIRKIGTVLLSIVIYHHQVNLRQWLGMFIVFIGVVLQVFDEIYLSKQKLKDQSQMKCEQLENEDNEI